MADTKITDLTNKADAADNDELAINDVDGGDLDKNITVESIKRLISWKQPVRVATTANGTLSTAYENGDTVDGVTLATGDRILLKDQSTGAENGIYTVNASGSPTRATDYDDNDEVVGSLIPVLEGTANGTTVWRNTNTGSVTVGTTALTYENFQKNKRTLVAAIGQRNTLNSTNSEFIPIFSMDNVASTKSTTESEHDTDLEWDIVLDTGKGIVVTDNTTGTDPRFSFRAGSTSYGTMTVTGTGEFESLTIGQTITAGTKINVLMDFNGTTGSGLVKCHFYWWGYEV